jgi:phosphoglucomutase
MPISYVTGPAPEGVTNKIFDLTKSISEYKICQDITVDLATLGTQSWDVEGCKFTVTIKDSVEDYVVLMKEIFDFPLLKAFLSGSGDEGGMKLLVNSMNGGTSLVTRDILKNLMHITCQGYVMAII